MSRILSIVEILGQGLYFPFVKSGLFNVQLYRATGDTTVCWPLCLGLFSHRAYII